MSTKLGQNFLIEPLIVKKIISSAHLNSEDIVVEIGPGKGILTQALLQKVNKVLAIEIDSKLTSFLKNKFAGQKKLVLINEDILKLNLESIRKKYNLEKKGYAVIANIPYYITAKIIRLFLESSYHPREMFLMVQKEVAERITAPPGKMSLLSVATQYYADSEILFTVNKKNFSPIPAVDSAVIKLIYKKTLPEKNSQKFFKIVKAGFCARRKTLLNNLSNSLHLDKNILEKELLELKLNKNTRAQELSIEDWKKLVKIF